MSTLQEECFDQFVAAPHQVASGREALQLPHLRPRLQRQRQPGPTLESITLPTTPPHLPNMRQNVHQKRPPPGPHQISFRKQRIRLRSLWESFQIGCGVTNAPPAARQRVSVLVHGVRVAVPEARGAPRPRDGAHRREGLPLRLREGLPAAHPAHRSL